MIEYQVRNQRLYRKNPSEVIASDQIGFVQIHVSFTGWEQMITKIIQFRQGDITINELLLEDYCILPSELVEGSVSLTVLGYGEEGIRAVTQEYTETIVPSGYSNGGEQPIPPTPDLYAQLLEQIAQAIGNTYTKEEIQTMLQGLSEAIANKANRDEIPEVPTDLSAFNNDVGYAKDSDIPAVPDWALQENKPEYSAEEVGSYTKEQADDKMSELNQYVVQELGALEEQMTQKLNEKMSFYKVTVSNTNPLRVVAPDGSYMTYQDLVDKYNDPEFFLYAEYQNLTFIPSLPPFDDPMHQGKGSIEFICSWIYMGEINVSRVICNSDDQVKYDTMVAELSSNKAQSIDGSTTKFPSNMAVMQYVTSYFNDFVLPKKVNQYGTMTVAEAYNLGDGLYYFLKPLYNASTDGKSIHGLCTISEHFINNYDYGLYFGDYSSVLGKFTTVGSIDGYGAHERG